MDRVLLRDLLAAGLSIDAIAERVDRSSSTVSYWLKRHGLRANGSKRFGRSPPLDPGVLRGLTEAGHSVPEIAAAVDRSAGVVRRALAAHGLRTRQSINREAAAAAAAAGRKTIDLVCRRHRTTAHVLEGRGGYRCMRCRAEQVSEYRRRLKRTLIAEAGGQCIVCGYSRCEAALQFQGLLPWM